jgi:hypothetical protein
LAEKSSIDDDVAAAAADAVVTRTKEHFEEASAGIAVEVLCSTFADLAATAK